MRKIGLTHSGGSRFGAYEVGVTHYLYEHKFKPTGKFPSVFSGTSVGDFNCGHLSQYTPPNAMQGIKELIDRWVQTETTDVWQRHFPFGMLHGLWRKSIYDSSPMRAMLRRWFNPELVKMAGNEFYMGVVSLDDGKYHLLSVDNPDPHECMAASAAMPLFFEPRVVDIPDVGKKLCADGGVRCATPLRAAFKAGVTELYVCLTEAKDMHVQTKLDDVIDIGPRFIAMLAHNVFVLDLGWSLAENELARHGLGGKKYVDITVIRPEEPLSGDPLDFSPKRSKELIEQGYEDAKKQVG